MELLIRCPSVPVVRCENRTLAEERAAVRRGACANGHAVSVRGRISAARRRGWRAALEDA